MACRAAEAVALARRVEVCPHREGAVEEHPFSLAGVDEVAVVPLEVRRLLQRSLAWTRRNPKTSTAFTTMVGPVLAADVAVVVAVVAVVFLLAEEVPSGPVLVVVADVVAVAAEAVAAVVEVTTVAVAAGGLSASDRTPQPLMALTVPKAAPPVRAARAAWTSAPTGSSTPGRSRRRRRYCAS